MTLPAWTRTAGRIVYGLLLAAIGLALALGGAKLIWLGGSLYYLPAGLMALLSGYMVLKGRWWTGAAVFGALLALTLVWALCEAGLDGWSLMPRVVSPLVLGLPFLLAALFSRIKADRQAAWLVLGVGAVLGLSVWGASGFTPVVPAQYAAAVTTGEPGGEWPHFGNDQAGTHFSPLTQIDKTNAGKLKLAWQVPLGPMPMTPAAQIDASPLKIGDHLYVCTPFNEILDVVPETGKVRWRYQAPRNNEGLSVVRCRGVAYYAVPGASGLCARRILSAVSDGARLVALDADTGALCPGFGQGGISDIAKGMKQRNHGYYTVSSAPQVIRGKVVFGGAVADGQHVGEPSGVVRAYDAVTGKLAWAWDLGNPGKHGEPGPGEFYTPGTPNSWGPMSGDEELGLVYVPTGNSTPDYWGGHRSDESNKYSSSVVAIDAMTGEPRWHFQTTHYDVWDLDVASQPVLFELRKDGATVPALIQPTKRGELFVLDRRTGKPLFPVEEKPAPQRGADETTKISPTQPWSTAFPSLMGPLLTERRMWGISALDQLWCRIPVPRGALRRSSNPAGPFSGNPRSRLYWWLGLGRCDGRSGPPASLRAVKPNSELDPPGAALRTQGARCQGGLGWRSRKVRRAGRHALCRRCPSLPLAARRALPGAALWPDQRHRPDQRQDGVEPPAGKRARPRADTDEIAPALHHRHAHIRRGDEHRIGAGFCRSHWGSCLPCLRRRDRKAAVRGRFARKWRGDSDVVPLVQRRQAICRDRLGRTREGRAGLWGDDRLCRALGSGSVNCAFLPCAEPF